MSKQRETLPNALISGLTVAFFYAICTFCLTSFFPEFLNKAKAHFPNGWIAAFLSAFITCVFCYCKYGFTMTCNLGWLGSILGSSFGNAMNALCHTQTDFLEKTKHAFIIVFGATLTPWLAGMLTAGLILALRQSMFPTSEEETDARI